MTNQELLSLRRQVMERDFSRMNARQQEAVFSTEGPLLAPAAARPPCWSTALPTSSAMARPTTAL